jgi:HEAT repeat protein
MSNLNEFVERLSRSDEAERTYAAEDIGFMNGPEGVPVLLERLEKEPSRAVRDAIFQALIRIDAKAAIEGCIGLLESDDPQIRNQAVEVLRSKGPTAFPFLGTLMREGDKDLRKLVLDVLSALPAGGAEDIYEAALSDPDPNVVITAVEIIGQTRAVQFRCTIEKLLLADSHPMLCGACLEALAGMGNEQSLVAIRLRFQNLAALPELFLVSCLKAIGSLGTERDFGEVADLLAVRPGHLRPAILTTLNAIYERHPTQVHCDHLLPILQAMIGNDDSPLSSYQAVRALRYLSPRDEVHSLLVSCLSHPERLIRLGAIETLRETKWPDLDRLLALRAIDEPDEEILQALYC